MHKPLIVAHRGASAWAPENTLAAFARAIGDGAEGIEFDVRLAKDGVAVVFHDDTLERTAFREGKIADLTSAELSQIDVGSWFDKSSRNGAGLDHSLQRITTLAETLEFLTAFRGLIYVELKCTDAEVIPLTDAVCRACAETSLSPQIIIKSFQLAVIPRVRAISPGLTTAALFAPKMRSILRKEKYLVNIAKDFGADELSLHYSLATRNLMEVAEKRGLPVTIWTADNPRWVKRSIKLGVKAIITNDPARLLKRRAGLVKN